MSINRENYSFSLDKIAENGAEEGKRFPGVPGTVRTSIGSIEDFEKTRREEARQFSLGNTGDAAGPSVEELSRFTTERLMGRKISSSGRHHGQPPISASENRSILHFRPTRQQATILELPPDAPDCYKYPPDAPTSLACQLPKKLTAPAAILLGHSKAGVSSLQFNARFGQLLLSGGLDGRVKVWSAIDTSCLRTLIGHERPVRQVVCDPIDGTSFASVSADRSVKLWDLETGSCVVSLSQKRSPRCAAFLSSRHILLVGLEDGRIQEWDCRQRVLRREYWQHTDAVLTLTTAMDDALGFVSTGEDRTVRLWERGDTSARCVLGKPDVCEVFGAAAIHPTDSPRSLLLSSASSSQLVVFGVATDSGNSPHSIKRRPRQLVGHQTAGIVVRPAFSADGRFVAAGDGAGNVCMWDWVSGQLAKSVEGAHDAPITDCAFSPVDPRLLATCSLDGSIKLWT